jgi:hypothetical protein
MDEENFTFGPKELQRIDDQKIVHVPTGTTISFFRYEELPGRDEPPSGEISYDGTFNDTFSEPALGRFRAEAWKVMWRHRSRARPGSR